MRHTRECRERNLKYRALIKDYSTRWPDYCRTCGATGIDSWSENAAPHGSSRNWPLVHKEPCSACAGFCPRCKHEFTEDEYDEFVDKKLPCPECNWGWGSSSNDYAPVEPECFCWMQTEIDDGKHRREMTNAEEDPR